MNTTVISTYSRMIGMLDDEYTLYENGDVKNVFDANPYPGNQNKKRLLIAKELKQEIKEKLLENASEANKEMARFLLDL